MEKPVVKWVTAGGLGLCCLLFGYLLRPSKFISAVPSPTGLSCWLITDSVCRRALLKFELCARLHKYPFHYSVTVKQYLPASKGLLSLQRTWATSTGTIGEVLSRFGRKATRLLYQWWCVWWCDVMPFFDLFTVCILFFRPGKCELKVTHLCSKTRQDKKHNADVKDRFFIFWGGTRVFLSENNKNVMTLVATATAG